MARPTASDRHDPTPGPTFALIATLIAAIVVALTFWRFGGTMTGTPVTDPTAGVDPATLDRFRDYRNGTWTLATIAWLTAPVAAVTLALTWRRWAGRLSRACRGKAWRIGIAFAALLTVGNLLIAFPRRVVGFWWGTREGIITQGTGAWLVDVLKAFGVSLVIAALTGAVVAVAIRRSPRRWWAWCAGTAMALVALGSLATPLLVEPLFQRTEPLQDQALATDIRTVATREGVSVDAVLVNDASSRTTAANAYVSGLGATRRIVVYDTLLRDFPRDQVTVVVAHEIAHVKERHILWGTALGMLTILTVIMFAFPMVERRAARWSEDGVEPDTQIIGRLALLAAIAALAAMVAQPASNLVSRAMEREADRGALLATDDPAAVAGLYRGLVSSSRAVPQPPAWVRVIFGTHPSLAERVSFAERGAERS